MLLEIPARWIRVSEAESSLDWMCPWLNIPWNGGRCLPSLCSWGHLEVSGWAPAIQTHTLHLNSLHPAPEDYSQGSSGTFCPSTVWFFWATIPSGNHRPLAEITCLHVDTIHLASALSEKVENKLPSVSELRSWFFKSLILSVIFYLHCTTLKTLYFPQSSAIWN